MHGYTEYVKTGKIKVFGEVMALYKGKTLADSSYQPYLAICEKYGLPVAYHSGGSFPNAQQFGWPKYRITLGDPFLIEEVLVKYPKWHFIFEFTRPTVGMKRINLN